MTTLLKARAYNPISLENKDVLDQSIAFRLSVNHGGLYSTDWLCE